MNDLESLLYSNATETMGASATINFGLTNIGTKNSSFYNKNGLSALAAIKTMKEKFDYENKEKNKDKF